jgi:hypothetical protein
MKINRIPIRGYYYILLIKETNTIILSQSKQHIANKLGICVRTINRNIDTNGVYDTKEYTIWVNVPLLGINRGFNR